MVFVCHVILKYHMIKGSSDSIGRRSSYYVTTLPRLVAINITLVEMFLVVEKQLSTCLLTSAIAIYLLSTWHVTHTTGQQRLEQQQIKHTKNVLSVHSKILKRKRKVITKFFELHTKALT